jgi:hypothetical protein
MRHYLSWPEGKARREWRFYEAADFVKTRWKLISFIFDPFWPPFGNNSPLWLWCLIIAAAFTPQ